MPQTLRVVALRALIALAANVAIGSPVSAQSEAPPSRDSTPNAAPREPSPSPYRARRLASGWGLVGTYALTVLGAGAMGDSFLALTATPVVGPWLTIAAIEGSAGKYRFQSGAKPLLVASGLLQGALLASWLDARIRERRWARRVVVVPTAEGVGMVAAFTF